VKKTLSIILAVMFIPAICAFSQETITLTTYYPAPFGVYQELRVHGRMVIGDANQNGTEAGVINNNDLPVNKAGQPLTGGLAVANNIGIGTHRINETFKLHIRDDVTTTLGGIPYSGMVIANQRRGGFSLLHLLSRDTGNRIHQWVSAATPQGQFILAEAGYDDGSTRRRITIFADPSDKVEIGSRDSNINRRNLIVTKNIGVDIKTSTPVSNAPNGLQTGNIDINDAWVRAANGDAGQWLSKLGDVKVFYASDTQSAARHFTNVPKNLPPYFDPYLRLRVPVKKGDIVKVTVAGAIRGSVYTYVVERTGKARLYRDGINSANWPAATAVVDNNWVPLHLMSVYEAAIDTTLMFQQGFVGFDLSGDTYVAARSAVAEVITP